MPAQSVSLLQDEPPYIMQQGISHCAADTAIGHSNQFFTSTRQVTIPPPPADQIGIDIDLAHADGGFQACGQQPRDSSCPPAGHRPKRRDVAEIENLAQEPD